MHNALAGQLPPGFRNLGGGGGGFDDFELPFGRLALACIGNGMGNQTWLSVGVRPIWEINRYSRVPPDDATWATHPETHPRNFAV